MKFGVAIPPGVDKVVGADHAGIGGGALSEIERSVGTEDEIVVLVVSQRRQPGDQVFALLAFKIEGADFASVRKIKFPLPQGQPIQGAVKTAGQLADRSIGRDPEHAGFGLLGAVNVA